MDGLDRRAREASEREANRDLHKSARVESPSLGENTLLELIGPLDRVPYLAVDPSSLVTMQALDHRKGFLLAQVAGRLYFYSIIDVSGMTRLETMRVFVQLLDDGILRVA